MKISNMGFRIAELVRWGLLLAAVEAAAQGVELAGSAAYRFDGVAAHIWEMDAGATVSPKPGLSIGGRILYTDATQDSIQGIIRLRGRIVTGLADVSWQTLRNKLLIKAALGVDGILGWKAKPTGELSCKVSLPLPLNPVFQNLALTPSGWYRHRSPNGPAIRNHVASYGYATELSATMGAKGAIAVNFRQEFLSPANPRLDTSFIDTGTIHYYHDELPVFNLEDNSISSFYAYIYRQVLKPLYVGYAFSWTDSRNDRRVTTDVNLVPVMTPGGPPIAFKNGVAYYPYVTPREMLAHTISLTTNIGLGQSVAWKSNVAFPIYSRQDIQFLPVWDWESDTGYAETDLNLLLHPENYPEYEHKFTGPLTITSDVTIRISPRTKLVVAYDYFGFPYESWAYFTKNSYSLHRVKVSVEYRG